LSTSFHKLEFRTTEGSSYIINFTIFEANPLADKVTVYDLVLSQEKNKGQENYEVLNFLGNEVLKFLEKNSGIVYFYSDHADIRKSEKNQGYSNQEFRNKLFSSMFERKKRKVIFGGNTFEFVLRNIQIKDPKNGDHFISLISKKDCLDHLENLADQILSIGEK